MATDDHDRCPDKGKPASPSELRRLLLRVIDSQAEITAKLARIEARNAIIEAMLKGVVDTQSIEFGALSLGVTPTDRPLSTDEVAAMLGDVLRKRDAD